MSIQDMRIVLDQERVLEGRVPVVTEEMRGITHIHHKI
jgi:hypothetical protein